MKTKTLIQASANILRVTELEKGNVVKILEKDYSSTESKFGIVLDLLNSGEETFIEMLIFTKTYQEVSGKVKLFNGNEDLAIFPATIEEVKEDLGRSLVSLQEDIEKSKKELQVKIEGYNKAESFVSGEMSKQLTEASFEELTTGQYIEEKKIKQIEAIKGE